MTQLMDWVVTEKWVQPGGYNLSWVAVSGRDRISIELGELELSAKKVTFYRAGLLTHGGRLYISVDGCRCSPAIFSQLAELRETHRRLGLAGIAVTIQGDHEGHPLRLERATGELAGISKMGREDTPARFGLGLFVQGLQHSYSA